METLEIENKGIVNKICQKLFKKPKISYVHLDKMIDLSAILNIPGAVFNIGGIVMLGVIILTLLKFSLWRKRK